MKDYFYMGFLMSIKVGEPTVPPTTPSLFASGNFIEGKTAKKGLKGMGVQGKPQVRFSSRRD
jgi:hypothetical protein